MSIQALREEALEAGEVRTMEAFDMFGNENMAYITMVNGMAVDQDDVKDLMVCLC